MRQHNNHNMLTFTGFKGFIDKINEVKADVEVEGKKCFDGCVDNIYNELYKKGKAAGLNERLLNQIDKRVIAQNGIWYAEVGWKKSKPTVNPLPDTYKVMFYNYGTPSRKTKSGANRGKIEKHGFIKRAKLAARNKNKKLQKETFEGLMRKLKNEE